MARCFRVSPSYSGWRSRLFQGRVVRLVQCREGGGGCDVVLSRPGKPNNYLLIDRSHLRPATCTKRLRSWPEMR